MRTAKPSELTERAVPVLTAKVTESELSRWFPVKFQEINDPEATAEPSKGALIKLAAGPYIVLFYGKESGQLVLEIPASADATANVDAFLQEVPIPPSKITWHRADIQVAAPKRAARSGSLSSPFKQTLRSSQTGRSRASRTSKKRA
jgi:hypothetical protein